MKKYILVLIILTFISLPAFAQMEKGDSEVQILGQYMTFTGEGGGGGTYIIMGKYGYFVTNNVELGASPLYVGNTESDYGLFGLGIFGTYVVLLEDGKTAPYGSVVYYIYSPTGEDSGDSISLLGLTAGVKYFMMPKVAMDFSGNYLMSLEEGSEGGMLTFLLGLSYLF